MREKGPEKIAFYRQCRMFYFTFHDISYIKMPPFFLFLFPFTSGVQQSVIEDILPNQNGHVLSPADTLPLVVPRGWMVELGVAWALEK